MMFFLKEATSEATSESLETNNCSSSIESYNIGIIRHPQDIVLFHSSHEEHVSFVCKIELAHFGVDWKVNGTIDIDLPGSHSRQIFNGNITTVELTFPAQSSYNQTKIQCVGYGYGNTAESKEATLSYQGICGYHKKT